MNTPPKKYRVLEHLGRSVCGRKYGPDTVFVMLTAYFDESACDERGLLVVASWLSDVRRWDEFESDWRIFLARYDQPYLHMKEYAHCKGPFAKWEGPEWLGTRRNFINDAAQIVSAHIQWGFRCYIFDHVFWRINEDYELTEMSPSPYALACWTAISMVNDWCERIGNISDIKYVFDDDGPDKGGLIGSIERTPQFLQLPAFESSRDIPPSPKAPHGKKGLVQLQSADYLAYETRRQIVDYYEKRPTRRSLRALPFSKVDTVYYTSTGLINICKKVNIPQRIRKR